MYVILVVSVAFGIMRHLVLKLTITPLDVLKAKFSVF